MIILVNFNPYLGGGETLLVRFASFLYKCNISFHAYCKYNSFISKQLKKEEIPSEFYSCIINNCDYPYLNKRKRNALLDEIEKDLPKAEKLNYLSFCLRDLYMLIDLNKRHEGAISHLVLHNQDYLYLGRTICDMLKQNITHRRSFRNRRFLRFNQLIINNVNQKGGLIPMSWIITQLWKKEIGVDIPEKMIVSLPSFSEREDVVARKQNNKRIIFIGRLVDFKFASLFAMFNFIKRNPTYHLTVVGKGDMDRVLNYIKDNNIPIENIHFVGEVSYSELPKVIAEHSIGYAAGTSIIECAQQGIPVIMALQNNANKPFKRDICGGLFFNTSKGNLGEDLCLCDESDIQTTIDEVISEIEDDYESAARRCYDYVKKEFSNDLNFEKYVDRVSFTMPINTSDVSVPQAGYFRSALFLIHNKD